MAKDKKTIFKPKAQEVAPIDEKYSQEDVEKHRQLSNRKKRTRECPLCRN